MKKQSLFLSTLFFLFFSTASAQSFHSFVNYVNSLADATAKMAAVDSFMLENQELPHIYLDTATFVYRGNVNSVSITGDFNGWNQFADQLTLLADTDLWYLSKTFELNALLEYLFVINGSQTVLDPNNPHTQQHVASIHSVLAMPEYVWPWEVNEYPNVSKGTLEDITINSSYTNYTYEIQVYLPYDYQATGGNGYPTVYFNDGNGYLGLMNASNILDNLIDSMLISEVIGVFVTPINREEEYGGIDRVNHRMFFVNELVPYIDSAYNTQEIPEQRAIIGVSAGGNIATLIGYNHSDLFGNIGLHSAALLYNNYEAYNLVINGDKKDIRWSLIWGSYDLPFIIPNMMDFRDQLLNIGYDPLEWRVLPEGHAFGLFRATTDDMLIFFFPPNSVGVSELDNSDIIALTVFPNPSDGQVTASFQLANSSAVSLKIIDMNGRILSEINKGVLPQGHHKLFTNTGMLSSGIYLLILEVDGRKLSKKFIVF